MKKIIPFSKEILFNTKVYEINSISLEHTLKLKDNNICGEFIISGDYKKDEYSITIEPFIYNIPFDISLDFKYNVDNINIEIDDFNYELNDNKLIVNIMVSIDGVELEEVIEEVIEEPIVEDVREVTTLFDDYKLDEAYVTYHVHIYREDDSIDSIIKLYNIDKDELEKYNDLSNINPGSKLIIPNNEL